MSGGRSTYKQIMIANHINVTSGGKSHSSNSFYPLSPPCLLCSMYTVLVECRLKTPSTLDAGRHNKLFSEIWCTLHEISHFISFCFFHVFFLFSFFFVSLTRVVGEWAAF